MDFHKQVRTFRKSADAIFEMKDYTSATILYFKTRFAIHDLILQERIGRSPKDHTERFRMLEKEFPEEYKALDSEFNTYRSTYTRIMTKETCERIRGIIEDGIRNHQID